jgi:protein-tyrosine phosphatase
VLRRWSEAGVEVVLSLLAAEEMAALGVAEEAAWCEAVGMSFVSFPVEDFGVPGEGSAALLEQVGGWLDAGRTVVVHCRGGVGRSATIAAGLLVRRGSTPEAAFEQVGRARGLPVPETRAQRQWVSNSGSGVERKM